MVLQELWSGLAVALLVALAVAGLLQGLAPGGEGRRGALRLLALVAFGLGVLLALMAAVSLSLQVGWPVAVIGIGAGLLAGPLLWQALGRRLSGSPGLALGAVVLWAAAAAAVLGV